MSKWLLDIQMSTPYLENIIDPQQNILVHRFRVSNIELDKESHLENNFGSNV